MVTMHKPTVVHDGPASITIRDWEMVILIVALIHQFIAYRASAPGTFENFSFLIFIEGALRIEPDTDSTVHFLAPKPIVLGDPGA